MVSKIITILISRPQNLSIIGAVGHIVEIDRCHVYTTDTVWVKKWSTRNIGSLVELIRISKNVVLNGSWNAIMIKWGQIVDLGVAAIPWTSPEPTQEQDSHMFSLAPKGHENVSEKLSFGTWLATQIGKTTVLKTCEKTHWKCHPNVSTMDYPFTRESYEISTLGTQVRK